MFTLQEVELAVENNAPVGYIAEGEIIPRPPCGWQFICALEQRGKRKVLIPVPTNGRNSAFWRECKRRVIAEATNMEFAALYVAAASSVKLPYTWYAPVFKTAFVLAKDWNVDQLSEMNTNAVQNMFSNDYVLFHKEAATALEMAKAVLLRKIKLKEAH